MPDARPQRALSALAGRFKSREALALQVEHTGDGTLASALDAGITASNMPEGDEELAAAWKALEEAWRASPASVVALAACIQTVEVLLDD